tara:strand:- start:2526 stop:5489 length:2964 start_codon:yes stop_codon:yes gene_type:complete
MKKITILAALLFSAIGIGQNLSQETVQPYNGQQVRTTSVTTPVDLTTPSLGLSPASSRTFNGTSYNNPGGDRMMPVLAYTSGPYFSVPGTPDVSLLEDTTLGMGTYGAGVQISAGNRIAEDIILADDYDITSMDFFAYQSFTPTAPPTIDAINVQIWDGDPSLGTSSVIYGDATTNVLTSVVWSGAYRQLESSPNTDRAIHRITVETPGLSLAAGTYWVDWQIGGTAASGPWQPPVAILGQTTTGNAMQSIGGVWAPLEDGGTFTPQGAPIEVNGDCTSCGGGGGATDFFVKDGFPTDNFGTMPIAGPYNIATIAPIPQNLFADDVASDGNLYAADFDNGNIYTVDTGTGAITLVSTAVGLGPNDAITGLAFDFQTDTMFALVANLLDLSNQLYTIDLTTGVLTAVGAGAAYDGGIWIEITNDGVGYIGSITDDSLWTVDLATGAATLVGPFGINLNFAQDAAFDVDTEILYGAMYDGAVSNISTIDLNTGAATILGTGNYEAVMLSLEGVFLTNDVCSNAIAMDCGDVETGDTSTNTNTGGFNDSPDAWYSYTGTGTQELVTFSLCDGGTSFDSRLTVYDACGGTQVANNDDSCGLQSEVSFPSDGTTTYYVAVEGFGTGDVGAFSLEVSCSPIADNDLCDNAAPITCGETILGSTLFGTPDAGSPDCGAGNNSPGVWYQIDDTSGLVTDYTVSLCDGGTSYDSKLVIYSGDDCGTLVCVAENDDSCGLQSEVSFQGDGNSTYYVLVNGFGSGNSGDFSLNLTCAPIPPFNDPIVNSIDVDEAGLPYTDPAVPMPAATTEAGGTPAECDNAGVLGVWYNFVPEINGTATATVVSPAGYTSVTFYTAPSEDAVETELTLVDWFDNQCVPGVTTSIPVEAGQAYYVYVANHEGITDIVIDGDFLLGAGDAIVEGFTYFPNPASDALNLDAGTRSIDSATIYNILGQTVVSQDVGTSSTRLDVANLSVGTYIMKVVVEGEVGIYKIVKK